MRDLKAFEGTWILSRRVENALGEDATLSGLARFAPEGAGLRLTERGEMRIGAQSLQAERSYLWQAAGPMIAVRFSDGRFFHDFDPLAERPQARHDCAPDLYRVTYDFSAWPDWSSSWKVSGPRKDYLMQTSYRRA
ncbi:DUF6314 family protein [Pseudooceanicola sp. HF7]|uniref:DUF6314 family protein n=1 Tax=Pseudooceanicola sp. HF7 TaxID=2721560 RepID=UPI0014321E92|nr:DUF6314 family protein [Pseudooceanicola sp. HF7]NIZ09837.1 trigger factor [Pseudooceanicola sp. HF7]